MKSRSIQVISPRTVNEYLHNPTAIATLIDSYNALKNEIATTYDDLDKLQEIEKDIRIKYTRVNTELRLLKGHLFSTISLFIMGVIGTILFGYGINLLSSGTDKQTITNGCVFLISGFLVNIGSFILDRLYNYGIKRLSNRNKP